MKQFFLPLGLLLSIVVALLLPAGGIFISENSGIKTLVIIIFLVSGYQAGAKGLTLDNRLFSVDVAHDMQNGRLIVVGVAAFVYYGKIAAISGNDDLVMGLAQLCYLLQIGWAVPSHQMADNLPMVKGAWK